MVGSFINVGTVLAGTAMLFCVGSLTVVARSRTASPATARRSPRRRVLDGFAAIALSANLGWGVGLSIVTILAVQGGITLGAGFFDDVLVGEALQVMSSAGGITIIAIALELLDLEDVKVRERHAGARDRDVEVVQRPQRRDGRRNAPLFRR